MKRLIWAAILFILSSMPSMAASEGFVVASCPGSLGVNAYTAGQYGAITVDVNGIQCTSGSGGGGGGTSSNFGSAFPTPGTAAGFTDGTNMVAAKVRTPGSNATTSDPALVTIDPNVLSALNNGPLGTTADAPCTLPATTAACTQIAVAKATANAVNGSVPAGSAIIGKVGIDQTTPGTTNGVQVNAALPAGTNAIGSITNTSFNGASNVTATDCSGTVATGGTAVNAFTAQTTLHGFTIFNTNTSEVMWISFTTTAAASTAGSYPIPAATATTFAGGGSFTSPPGFGLNHALSVVAATSAHSFSCTWW